jgi:hypothetical protein
MDALRAVFGQKRQIRRNNRPFVVGTVRSIRACGTSLEVNVTVMANMLFLEGA